MRYLAASFSKPGPRSINEDAISVLQSDSVLAVAIADGLGGMGGGKRASQIAISDFERYVHGETPPTGTSLRSLVFSIHKRIVKEQTLGEFREMATTFTAGIFSSGRFLGVHCGDTRISLARGSGIKRLTKDHSEAQRLLEAGKLTKDEYFDYPRRNILESALGIRGVPLVDLVDSEVKSGDKFFFTTDGIHNTILLREFRLMADLFSSPNELNARIDAIMEQRVAQDNYSIITVFASE